MPHFPPVTSLHKKIIMLMKDTGYNINDKGVCFGLSMMARQAVLLGEEEFSKFKRGITLITQMNATITSGDDLDLEMRAFLDGIYIYQTQAYPPNQSEESNVDLFAENKEILKDLDSRDKIIFEILRSNDMTEIFSTEPVVNCYKENFTQNKFEITTFLENLKTIRSKEQDKPIFVSIKKQRSCNRIRFLRER